MHLGNTGMKTGV